MSAQRYGDLEIDADLAFQRRTWVVQRIGWLLMLGVVIAAILGLFGRGLLSHQTEESRDGSVTVSYRQFERSDAPTAIELRVSTERAENGQVEVWIDRSYTDAMQMERIVPEPASVTSGEDRLILTFHVDQATPFLDIILHMRPSGIGWHSGRIGLLDDPSISFRQFVFP
jgi:hypothetical protein